MASVLGPCLPRCESRRAVAAVLPHMGALPGAARRSMGVLADLLLALLGLSL